MDKQIFRIQRAVSAKRIHSAVPLNFGHKTFNVVHTYLMNI